MKVNRAYEVTIAEGQLLHIAKEDYSPGALLDAATRLCDHGDEKGELYYICFGSCGIGEQGIEEWIERRHIVQRGDKCSLHVEYATYGNLDKVKRTKHTDDEIIYGPVPFVCKEVGMDFDRL